MPKPLLKSKKVLKHPKRFHRHHSWLYMRLKGNWRRPHGIDNAARRRFKGQIPMPNIGYGTERKLRHVLPSGFKKFRVFNAGELDVLLMQNRKYGAEIAGAVSVKKRIQIIERARQLDIKILNPRGKTRKVETE
eukprot:TRINITY_DN12758_c0_g1_i1.p1 TRINITY_DN12758_c0_g1~~TRINITY_DN12758_c0_g1_i1.p1  ORF type:complete len:134 (-),score=17.94 TRINITY_DN12758_c0_g1_i1:141-542(-)